MAGIAPDVWTNFRKLVSQQHELLQSTSTVSLSGRTHTLQHTDFIKFIPKHVMSLRPQLAARIFNGWLPVHRNAVHLCNRGPVRLTNSKWLFTNSFEIPMWMIISPQTRGSFTSSCPAAHLSALAHCATATDEEWGEGTQAAGSAGAAPGGPLPLLLHPEVFTMQGG